MQYVHAQHILYTVYVMPYPEVLVVRCISQQCIQWSSIVFHLHQELSGRLKESAGSLFSSALPICRQSALPISRYQSANLEREVQNHARCCTMQAHNINGTFWPLLFEYFLYQKTKKWRQLLLISSVLCYSVYSLSFSSPYY